MKHDYQPRTKSKLEVCAVEYLKSVGLKPDYGVVIDYCSRNSQPIPVFTSELMKALKATDAGQDSTARIPKTKARQKLFDRLKERRLINVLFNADNIFELHSDWEMLLSDRNRLAYKSSKVSTYGRPVLVHRHMLRVLLAAVKAIQRANIAFQPTDNLDTELLATINRHIAINFVGAFPQADDIIDFPVSEGYWIQQVFVKVAHYFQEKPEAESLAKEVAAAICSLPGKDQKEIFRITTAEVDRAKRHYPHGTY